MQLVIKNGKVQAVYPDEVNILDRYDLTECEIVEWDGPQEFYFDPETGDLADDPRPPAQRLLDQKERYLRRRRRAYPSVHRMLMMIFRDMRDGTTDFVDTIQAINDQFPPPPSG